jgi:hypothetical protein
VAWHLREAEKEADVCESFHSVSEVDGMAFVSRGYTSLPTSIFFADVIVWMVASEQ